MGKYRIEVDTLSIKNFDFSPEFQKAIEEKQTAAQLALKAENDLNGIMPTFYVSGQGGLTGGLLINVPVPPNSQP